MKLRLFLSVAIALLIVPTISLSMIKKHRSPQEKLFKGTRYNDLNLVQEALAEGADVNAKNDIGKTPLNIIIDHNGFRSSKNSDIVLLKIIELLLKSGAHVNEKNNYGNTPLYSLIRLNYDPNIIEMLLNAGADINIGSSYEETIGETALDVAKAKNNEKIIRLLTKWLKELRKKAKEETAAYLIPDISDIVCDYVVGSKK